jgi:hypothetical protein
VKTTNFLDCFWDWITADDTGEKFWYAKKITAGVVVFLIIPILIYFVVKWDPVIGIDEDGEPTQLGVFIIMALYWIIAYFSYRRHLDKLKLASEVKVHGYIILHIKGTINTEAKKKLIDEGFKKIIKNTYNGFADWNHNIDKDIQTWKIVMNNFNHTGYLINIIENDSDFEEVIWTLTKDEEI